MNLMRTTVLAGVLTIGGLGFGASSARAQCGGGVGCAPYASGYATPYYGSSLGGYAGPATYYANPSVGYSGRTSYYGPARAANRPVRDPSGRDVPLYKPWLQPLR